jgi:excisionase family DNA binding protein
MNDDVNAMLFIKLDAIIRLLQLLTVRQQLRPQRLLKTTDAARYLGISPRKLRKLIQAGEIAHIVNGSGSAGVWLCDVRDLDDWVSRSKS